jgi:hypothetical protein
MTITTSENMPNAIALRELMLMSASPVALQ